MHNIMNQSNHLKRYNLNGLLPLYKPDEGPSEFTCGLQAKEGTLWIEDTSPMNIKMAFEITEFLILDDLNKLELLPF
jgi:hypothetical protein